METRRSQSVLVVLAVPVIAAVAVVGTRLVKGASDGGPVLGSARSVLIKNFSFSPPTLTVPRGTSIKITNGDGTAHTLTASDGSFGTKILNGGATTTLRLDTPGRFAYVCSIHATMHGALVVT